MFYAYVLMSKVNGAYYFGSCKNIKQRLDLHNHGLVISTKRYLPWRIAYYERFENLCEARARESQFKLWKKRSVIEKLIKHSKFK